MIWFLFYIYTHVYTRMHLCVYVCFAFKTKTFGYLSYKVDPVSSCCCHDESRMVTLSRTVSWYGYQLTRELQQVAETFSRREFNNLHMNVGPESNSL